MCAKSWENPVFEYSEQVRLKPVYSATETSYNIETFHIADFVTILLERE